MFDSFKALRACLWLALTVMLVPDSSQLHAADGTWTNLGGGVWTNTINWNAGSVAGGTGAIANFTAVGLAADTTIALGGDRTVGTLLFADRLGAHDWTLNSDSGGVLSMAVSSGSPLISLSNCNVTIASALAGANGLAKAGEGALSFTGTNTFTGVVLLTNGAVTFGGTGANTGNNALFVGGAGGRAVLSLNSSGTINFGGGSGMFVGGTGNGADSGFGVINQTSGTFTVNIGNNNVRFGAGGAGAFGACNLSGGNLTISGTPQIGHANSGLGGSGAFRQSGGVFTSARYFGVGSGSNSVGVATFTGGTATFGTAGQTALDISLGDASAGTGIFNVGTEAGGSASISTLAASGLRVGGTANGSGIINLNSGSLQVVGSLRKVGGATGVVNLNGGTLTAGANNIALMGNSLTAAYVYRGGAVMDSQGFTVTNLAALQPASGKGIYPSGGGFMVDSGGSGYLTAPLVAVSGGSGFGASAIATLAGGGVASVVLTCPGQNYVAGDVLHFTFSGGGATNPAPAFHHAVVAAELLDNSAGGLTKLGAGTLVAGGGNGYLGRTLVGAGTLVLDNTNGASGDYTIQSNATLKVQWNATGTPFNVPSLTLNSGASLSLSFISLGSSLTPAIPVAGVLDVANPVTLIVSAGGLAAGQFPLIQYGSLASGGAEAFNLQASSIPPGYAISLSNNVANKSIDAVVISMDSGPPFYTPPAGTFPLSNGWRLKDQPSVPDVGAVVSQTNYAASGWSPATVPGTVLGSLVNAGIYPEPLYGTNNFSIPDSLSRTPYWYRTDFVLPPGYTNNRVWLNFNGINYIADVWLNGASVGRITGAFVRGQFDVTRYARVNGTNSLAVLITPQPNPGAPHQKTMAAGTGHNGGDSSMDGPTFLCAVGWDWIPTIRDRDSGIWQEVNISSTGPLVMRDPYVTSRIPLPDTSSADLTVQVTISNTTAVSQSGVLNGQIESAGFQQPVSLNPFSAQTLTVTATNTPALHLVNPRLWWPNGFGAPNLYTLNLSLTASGVVSDTRNVNFGVRQVDHLVAGSSNLTLVVNGVPVIAKGGDWGMDEAMKRIPRRRLEAQIRMHQQANYTIIRNWVGQSTSEDFYDLCDRYGLLVWDEFFQPNPGDGPNPTDPDVYLANVRDKLLRFRNHPCIALWCGRNEGNPAPVAIATGNSNLLAMLDPSRFYQASSSSGLGVKSSGPYYWRAPRIFYTIDAPFKTEIGSVSVPTLEGIQSMMPEADWSVINDDWAEHDLCGGAQRGDSYAGTLAARYGPLSSLADFTRKAQLANYEAFRAMYEGRLCQLFNPVTGVITWMSNPAQPSFVWQIYSWDLEPLSSLFASRKACEPIHVMLNQTNWHWMVINSTPNPAADLNASLAIYNLDGSRVGALSNSVYAAPGAATDLGLVTFPAGVSPVHFVQLELRDSAGALLSDNFYWRETVQDNFQALDSLPRISLNVQAAWQQVGSNCVITATVSNPAPVVALMSHLQLRRSYTSERVLPVFYSDNYLSLLPGESRTITIEAAMADLQGEAPLLMVDGWNVSVQAVAGGGNQVAVAPNIAAQASSGTALPAGGPLHINAGGGQIGFYQFGSAASDGFTADAYSTGGSATLNTHAIDTSAPHVAPAAVYQSERWGTFSYVLPAPTPGACLVRLHFAEVKFAPGGRQFNVAINGSQVLTNFDIAAVGGLDAAVVRDFVAVPDAATNVVVAFSTGAADQAKVCGLELLPLNVSLGVSPAAAGRVTLTWPASPVAGRLYSATNLMPPVSWQATTDAVVGVNGTNVVTVPILPGSRFFQWRSQ